MGNTNADYWEVDGVSLQTFAFNIETIGGDRAAPPPLRGDNVMVPYKPGRVWQPKQVDERTLSLGMWVIGTDEDGFAPTATTPARQYDANFRKLRQLLWTPNKQFTITKRFYIGNTLVTASGKGQFADGLNPKMNGRARGVFTVDIEMADPFFYGVEKTVTLPTGTTVVNVEGDDRTRAIKINIQGARKYVKVRNATLNVDVELHYDLNSGDTADIDVALFESVIDPASLPAYSGNGTIRHTGDAFWLVLQPGNNSIQVSSTSGIGAVTMKYQEVWL